MSETFSTKNDVAPATQIHPHVARPRSIDGIDGLFWGMLLQSGCPSVFPHCSVLNSTIVYKRNSTGQETWFGNKHSHGIINGSQSRWMWDNFRCIEVLPLVINSFNDFKVHNFNTGYRYQSTSQRHFRSSLWAIGTHPWRQSAQWRLPANWPCNSGPFPEKVVVSCCIRTIQRWEGFWTILHLYNVYLGVPTIVIYHRRKFK